MGTATFRSQLLQQMDGSFKAHDFGSERQETDEARGTRIISEGLGRAGWKEKDLPARRKSDPVKISLALRLRRETTLTYNWIAGRLHMGTREYLNRLLYEAKKSKISQS